MYLVEVDRVIANHDAAVEKILRNAGVEMDVSSKAFFPENRVAPKLKERAGDILMASYRTVSFYEKMMPHENAIAFMRSLDSKGLFGGYFTTRLREAASLTEGWLMGHGAPNGNIYVIDSILSLPRVVKEQRFQHVITADSTVVGDLYKMGVHVLMPERPYNQDLYLNTGNPLTGSDEAHGSVEKFTDFTFLDLW